jgi:hypothetical protein
VCRLLSSAVRLSVRRYWLEADSINARARQEREKADGYQARNTDSHHKADSFDLGVELALVLSSVTILTKQAG